jgi:hypothetical protein
MAKNQQTDRMIVVLNDGETYSTLNGCQILTLTDSGLAKLDEGLGLRTLEFGDISQHELLTTSLNMD